MGATRPAPREICANGIAARRVCVAARGVGRAGTRGHGKARLLLRYGLVPVAAPNVTEVRPAVDRDGADALGLPVHAFDRAGSGVSEADGGCRLDDLLAEIDVVADAALVDGQHQAIHLIGHCSGAIVALLYAAPHRPDRVASLALATPALYTRTDLDARAKLRVLSSVIRRRGERIAIPLSPDDFSEVVPFVELVRGDLLVLRTAPARLFYEIRRARSRLRAAASALRTPLLAAMAGTYAGARHILEFSGASGAFLDDLAAWYRRQESA